jgi:hypothetical protein
MSIMTPAAPPVITAAYGQAGAMGTSHGLLEPVRGVANHVLGRVQTGLIHSGQWPTGAEGTGRVWTYRHPNATSLVCWVYVSAPTKAAATFEITAGAGATQTRDVIAAGAFWISVPWAVADSGWNLVEYTSDDCDILAIELWGLTRSSLDPATEPGCDIVDPGHAMAGLGPGEYLIHDSHEYNVDGLALTVREASKYNLRHHVTWCAIEGSLSVTPGAGVAASPFGFEFSSRARWLKAGHTYRLARVQARTWEVGAGTYTWSATSTMNTTTTAALAGTAAAPDTATRTDLQVDCQADDSLGFEMTPSAGQTLHITDLSIVEYL